MKKNLFILLMLVICTGLMASGQTKKKHRTAAKPATAASIVGHTYAKHDAKICDRELAEAYDNGTFKLVLDVSIYFVTENVMQFTMTADLVSRVYSKAEMEQAKAAMGLNEMNETDEHEYYVKNGYIYLTTQKEPIAVINKGGQSITLKTLVPFDGNTLPRIE